MSTNVYLKSGEQPRYFAFSGGVTGATGATVSNPIYKESPLAAFQVIVTGSGTVGATVGIQVSNEEATGQGVNSNWITMGTISVTGSTAATDGFTTVSPWRFVRLNVTGVTGTSATVAAIMGV